MGKFKRYNLSRRKKRLSESTPPLEDEIYEITSTLPKEEEIINQESPQSIEDIITEDGILCSILSSLSLKEAVGTCVLSSRWRHLWTNLPKLHFNAANMFDTHTVPDLQKEINSFTHLTGLDWCWNVYNQKMSLHHLTTLLDATPLLEELILRLQAKCPIEKAPERLRKLRETLPDEPHPYLKTVWFVDFYWDLWHVEFLLYLRKNATQLRTLKIANGSRGLDKTTIRKILYVLPQRIELVVC